MAVPVCCRAWGHRLCRSSLSLFDGLCHKIRFSLSLKFPAVGRFSIWSTHEFMEEKLNVRISSDLPENKPWQGGKSQTAQGEAQRNPGNMTSNYINQDWHWRIWRSGTEWHIRQCDDFPELIASTMNSVPAERLQRGGCHRAMLFNILPQGYASLTLGCLTLAALSGLVFR